MRNNPSRETLSREICRGGALTAHSQPPGGRSFVHEFHEFHRLRCTQSVSSVKSVVSAWYLGFKSSARDTLRGIFGKWCSCAGRCEKVSVIVFLRSRSVRIPFAFVRFKSVLMLRLWVLGMNCQGGALLDGGISNARGRLTGRPSPIP